jgi:hypothetical protein
MRPSILSGRLFSNAQVVFLSITQNSPQTVLGRLTPSLPGAHALRSAKGWAFQFGLSSMIISVMPLPEQIIPEQIAAFRAMSGTYRLRLAEQLYWSARKMKTAGVRSQHPDWSPERVREEVRQLFSNART